MRIYYVYILKCSDDSYYTGVTNNLERRFTEHTSGIHPTAYTHSRRPLQLIFYRSFKYINDAIAFEKQVKKWSRKKKEAIANECWDELSTLAECQNETHSKNKKAEEK
ncbi:GIY-YIG nuclease family protein [Dyadobacter pollutisoli]|jgi:putative endonuclease|uniref:GIY-YIG nuclease family protein n=1 Tax=Dyadobacter pollutisoli TaxID=2910158 RepID=A0A9E8N9S0_9BACT|nr:GIY-YIG nuclease family protein [Dyadobacter pollutisoli]WAC11383.1 GIY-YIG nuclease family protein [Dyadobacter pollutisoli]